VRVAALEKAIEALSQHKFAWNDNYVATSEPGHKIEVTMAGVAGDQFMARTQTSILIGQTSDLPMQPPQSGDRFTLEPSVWRRAYDT
jgi:cell filamentation protein